ncbi:murein hydrolase activator EnvC [Acidisphaera sp. L21]|uniref:murein hydrolase activator EnvC family protein n=1 Tax=Acidisphaera sp. L21 TaxID=1641851 RepID=UPI00131AC3CB|nr:peptidoglycan DD-metalloendopeptidase family protein [Acidisphaera sp. L21]
MDGRVADPGDVTAAGAPPRLFSYGRALGAPLALWLMAASQPTPAQLTLIEQKRAAELAASRAAAARQHQAEIDAKRLAQARVTTTASLRTLEQATADAATTMSDLARRRAEAESRLAARSAELGPLLPLIERLSLYPAETLLAVPGSAQSSLTGLLVLKGMARQLEADAEAVRAEQAEVTRLAEAMAMQERHLTAAQAAQFAQAAGLDQQISEAKARSKDAEDAAAAAAQRAADQAGQAETLRAALTQLDTTRRQDEAKARADAALAERQRQDAAAADARRRQLALAQPAGPGLGDAKGQVGAPVAGSVVKAFGEPGDAGTTSGISYAVPPAARVSAPCDGKVVFAGPFRSFGQLMIVDCGGGYHFVLAGLDRLDVAVGHPVQSGEPVGVMPSWDPRSTANRPLLYLELRQKGQPINPAPFLRGRS